MTGQLELAVERRPIPHTRPPGMKESAWMVLRRLTQGPACQVDFWNEMRMNRQAARIGELRDLGWDIDKRLCGRHGHEARVHEYYLVGGA